MIRENAMGARLISFGQIEIAEQPPIPETNRCRQSNSNPD